MGASHYLGTPNPLPPTYIGTNHLCNFTCGVPITISDLAVLLYDDGALPTQIGNNAVVDVYYCPTTWTGNHNPVPVPTPASPTAPWVFAGTGTLTVADSNSYSPITFATPFTIPAGAWGVAVHIQPPVAGTNAGPLHPLVTLPTAVPSTPLSAMDQFLLIDNEVMQREAFTGGVGGNHTINLKVSYTVPANAAHSQSFGAGCYFRPQMAFEHFGAPTNFDLQNSSIYMIFSGANYVVAPSPTAITPPISTSLSSGTFTSSTTANWDDALVTVTLPWAFPFAGGSTTTISAGSNGEVYLGLSTFAYGYYSQLTAIRNELVPSISCAYGDWDLALVPATEGLFFDVDPSGTKVYITWKNVPEWVPANNAPQTNNFQMVLHQNGDIEFRYGTVASSAAEVLVGYCQGSGVQSPGSTDWSATMPFVTGDGSIPSIQGVDARPVLGTTINNVTTNIQAGTFFNLLVVGFAQIPGGLDLGAFGLPGCKQWITAIATTNFGPVVNGVATTPMSIPLNVGFAGVTVYTQSAPFTPGLNAAGILTSSGACLVLNVL